MTSALAPWARRQAIYMDHILHSVTIKPFIGTCKLSQNLFTPLYRRFDENITPLQASQNTFFISADRIESKVQVITASVQSSIRSIIEIGRCSGIVLGYGR